jgi:hypothetical protein
MAANSQISMIQESRSSPQSFVLEAQPPKSEIPRLSTQISMLGELHSQSLALSAVVRKMPRLWQMLSDGPFAQHRLCPQAFLTVKTSMSVSKLESA